MNSEKLIEKRKDGSYVIKHMLFYLNSKREIGIRWSYFLYISFLEFLILAGMLILNFLGLVPTNDYSFTVLLHIGHVFSWAATYSCISKNFNYSIYKATMILYGFMVFTDMAAFVWRIIDISICSGTQCDDNLVYGIVGTILSAFFVAWDIVVFISISFILKHLLKFVKAKIEQVNSILLAADENESSVNPECDERILKYFRKIAKDPPPNTDYEKRIVLVVAVLADGVLFFGLLFTMMLGLVINEDFMWSIFLGSLHFFSWVFVVSCIYNNYSKKWFKGTMGLYIANLVLDIVAFTWRSIALILCDPYTNVDCVFRTVPGWFPIQFFGALAIIVDAVIIITLSNFYGWMMKYIWTPASTFEKCIAYAKNSIDQESKPLIRKRTVNPNKDKD